MAQATVLPEDRADVMYHAYDGGGIKVDGPSILVRKKATKNLSVSANYYVDKISSASIDVIATASKYAEERKEKTVGVDYLHEKNILSLSYTQSDENDFNAKTFNFGVAQDFFGDMTTLSLSFSRGTDDISTVNGSETFDADRQNYRVGLSQILTANWLAQANVEIITDEGLLNNPYRQVRYVNALDESGQGFSYEKEKYPNTRTSHAYALSSKYYLPYNASLSQNYRYFDDTWGIKAHTVDLSYAHAYKDNWLFDIHYRYYTQDKADFYSDIFNYSEEFTFRARDKELSTFDSQTVGIGFNYTMPLENIRWLEKGGINFYWDYIQFDYDDFRNVLKSSPESVGEEPLYGFSANVIRLFVSVWY